MAWIFESLAGYILGTESPLHEASRLAPFALLQATRLQRQKHLFPSVIYSTIELCTTGTPPLLSPRILYHTYKSPTSNYSGYSPTPLQMHPPRSLCTKIHQSPYPPPLPSPSKSHNSPYAGRSHPRPGSPAPGAACGPRSAGRRRACRAGHTRRRTCGGRSRAEIRAA